MVLKCSFDSPLGPLTAAAEDEKIVGLWFAGQKYFPATEMKEGDCRSLAAVREWMGAYFRGEKPPAGDITLDLRGTEFRRRVWAELVKIPYGKTVTYGDIASRMGLKNGARAVGGAVGHNPVSVIVPCHRVMGAGGTVTGYAGGVERKIELLKIEGIIK